MTYSRPGVGTHVVNDTGGNLNHGQAAVLQNHVGVVVKQKQDSWSAGLATAALIPNGQKCWMITKGIVQVDDPGLTNDSAVYITSGNVLTNTSSGNTKFGRVVEVPGDGRGVPTGKIRIDLDGKDSF